LRHYSEEEQAMVAARSARTKTVGEEFTIFKGQVGAAGNIVVKLVMRFFRFMVRLAQQFWKACGAAISAAAVAGHRRTNGPLGGGAYH
jgi:hypothetical protein